MSTSRELQEAERRLGRSRRPKKRIPVRDKQRGQPATSPRRNEFTAKSHHSSSVQGARQRMFASSCSTSPSPKEILARDGCAEQSELRESQGHRMGASVTKLQEKTTHQCRCLEGNISCWPSVPPLQAWSAFPQLLAPVLGSQKMSYILLLSTHRFLI